MTGIYRTRNCILWIALGLLGLFALVKPVHVDAFGEFCHPVELGDSLHPFLRPGTGMYRRTSQGMCVAEDYIIYTRYDQDWEKTTYVILDIKTQRELAHYDFDTLHSNSLAYNPYTRELVAVSKRHAYIFQLRGRRLTLVRDIIMTRNCPKITYIPQKNVFYVGTDDTIYETTDFLRLTPVFKVKPLAVDQGMGFDGTFVYIIWYRVGHTIISLYTPDGKYAGEYRLNSSTYREVEEVDFYNGKMVVNIANSGSNDGIYYILPSHSFGKWKIEVKPTCGDEGSRVRYCTKCGIDIHETVAPTGKHKLKKWEITIHPSCQTEGYAIKKCKVCGQTVKGDVVPATGHHFGKWKMVREATVFKEGVRLRKCKGCSVIDKSHVPKVKAFARMNYKEIETGFGKKINCLKVETAKGDYIRKWTSSNPGIVSVDEDGRVKTYFPGRAVITIKTAGGASASCVFRVRLLPGRTKKFKTQ